MKQAIDFNGKEFFAGDLVEFRLTRIYHDGERLDFGPKVRGKIEVEFDELVVKPFGCDALTGIAVNQLVLNLPSAEKVLFVEDKMAELKRILG